MKWTRVTLYPVTAPSSHTRIACGDHFINVDRHTGAAGLFYQGMGLGDFATVREAKAHGEDHIAAIAAAAADEDYMGSWAPQGEDTWTKDRVEIWRSNGNMLAYPGDPNIYLTSVVLITQAEATGTKLAKEGGVIRSAGRHKTLAEAQAAAAVLPVAQWVAEAHATYRVKTSERKN